MSDLTKPPSRKETLLRAVAVLAIPLLEFVLVRMYLKYGLHIRIGWPVGTDFHLLPPALISFFILFTVFDHTVPAVLKLRRTAVALNGLCFAVFLSLSLWSASFREPYSIAFLAGAILVLCMLASAFFVFLPAAYFFKHPWRYLMLPATFLALSGVLSDALLKVAATDITMGTGKLVCGALQSILPGTACTFTKAVLISYPGLAVAVGEGCSGVEGISLFLMLTTLYYFTTPRRFSPSQWVWVALCGTLFLALTNAIRIGVIFMAAVGGMKLWDAKSGVWVAQVFFHNIFAWIYYPSAIAVFFWGARQFWKSKTEPTHPMVHATEGEAI